MSHTGGAGYIGSHTALELILAGYLPIVVDNFCASDRPARYGILDAMRDAWRWQQNIRDGL